MKVVSQILLILAISIVPVYGQIASNTPLSESMKSDGNTVAAAEKSQPATPLEVPDGGNSFSVMRTAGGMGLVICLMIGIYFAAKKFAPRYFAKGASEKNLRVIETLAMGDRRSISLIEVANARFLVGSTPHQINLLAALPEPVSLVSEPEELSANPKETLRNDARTPFRKMFEVEKKRPSSHPGHPLPEDLRIKMRQLRETLER
jgi:flagellar biosynthetic protein FliO